MSSAPSSPRACSKPRSASTRSRPAPRARPRGTARSPSPPPIAASPPPGAARTPLHVSRYLTLAPENPSSIRSCLDFARSNAKSVRTALSRDAWEAINRAWLGIHNRATTGGSQTTLRLVETLRAETRGFEGALHRMLRNEAYFFLGWAPRSSGPTTPRG
jgi:hypothetical protein